MRDQSTRELSAQGSARLEAVVTTGASAAAPPNANQRFEAARSAAAQRSATSMATVDSLSRAAGGDERRGVRRVGERTFTLADGVWKDDRYAPSMRTAKVKAFSSAYFELISAFDGLSAAAALGEKVIVAGRSVAIEIGREGTERFAGRELAELTKAW